MVPTIRVDREELAASWHLVYQSANRFGTARRGVLTIFIRFETTEWMHTFRFEPARGCCRTPARRSPVADHRASDIFRRIDRDRSRSFGSGLLDLDLDVDACRELDALQRVDRLGVGVDDVDQPLVDAHLEVLA